MRPEAVRDSASHLEISDERGLSSAQAAERLRVEGPNALPEPPARPMWRRIFAQLQGALSVLLLSAVGLDFVLWIVHGAVGVPVEPIAILAVLLLNAGLGVLQEYRSEQALAELKSLSLPLVWVERDGELVHLPADHIVPGDWLRVEAGDRVAADASLVHANSLSIDESLLTGESLPIEKQAGEELFSGTLVARGTGFARVTRTGPKSTLGRLAAELSKIDVGRTPLERRLDRFGRQIAIVVGSLAALIVLVGAINEGIGRIGAIITFAVAFAVAVVPEGMPAVLTLALAIGVQRMVRRRAVVRRLAAVEALGSVTLIATDKTGTLTLNQMNVAEVHSAVPERALEAAILANEAEPGSDAGDPLDVALLNYAASHGVDVARVRALHPKISGRPFDSAWKFARHTAETPEGQVSFLKGAVETLNARSRSSPEQVAEFKAWNAAQAAQGRRVIAVARAAGEDEHDLEILGLISVWDPPRPNVREAMLACMSASVRVVMITGDHPETARSIASLVGMRDPLVITGEQLRSASAEQQQTWIASVDVVARATPEDKLFLVGAFQRSGEVVAMTGDGVNDAPALKKADVGVAMGERGSDVAREVSDLVLQDDNFATIVHAIEEGRNIYENIQRFIRFTFSTNVALSILVLGGAVGAYVFRVRDGLGALAIPLTAIQILFINFVGDGPPALALALDRSPDVMRQKPRLPNSGLLDGPALKFIAMVGVLQGGLGLLLLVLIPTWGFGLHHTQTAVFLYEAVAKLVSAYPARRVSGASVKNPVLHGCVAFGAGLALLCVYLPPVAHVLGLVALPRELLLIVTISLSITWLLTQILVLMGRWSGRATPAPPGSSTQNLRHS
ncbi:MAG TPA: cation-translocating P-type ATPase [Polyangiaceae bacterium]|nr:cation-translocating P-type ATPase [Polyangiaceae bacterium]